MPSSTVNDRSSPPVTEHSRGLLARSLPLVQLHRDLVVEQIERSLAADESEDEAFGQAEVTAMVLVNLLIDQVANLVRSGEFGSLRDLAAEHRALDITGRHYSRFGDTLFPVLRDVLGPASPREVATAWCDTFWTLIRAAQSTERPQAEEQLSAAR